MLEFNIPGKPIPQERPRFGRGRVFDSKRSRDRKREIGLLARVAMSQQKWKLYDGEVSVWLIFSGANPLSDTDNLTKLVWDSFNGIVWRDDRQVKLHAVLRTSGAEPYTFVRVDRWIDLE